MWIFKRLFCKHPQLMPHHSYVDSDNGVQTIKWVWICKHCGKKLYPNKKRGIK